MTIYLLIPVAYAVRISVACCLLLLILDNTIAYTPLSDDGMRGIPSGGNDFDVLNGSLLAPILIERVPGTEGSTRVQKHFVDFFTRELPEWEIEWHHSKSTTPATGNLEVPFSNLILRRDPPGVAPGNVSRLTLAAHYDSLRKSGFVGATDSAAPCAILMHVARSIDDHLQQKWYVNSTSGLDLGEKGVQILFLDGEESFSHWTATDSLYGARALAEAWENTSYPPPSIYRNRIESISLFVLLDLLGAQAPYVPSFFQNTHWAYQNMAAIEDRMRKLGLLESYPRSNFLSDATKTIVSHALRILARFFVEDDHIPFLRRGVDILHLIPIPFPNTWHTLQDDGEHLHLPTVRDWSKILTAFTMEWMDLEDVPLAAPAKKKPAIDKTEL